MLLLRGAFASTTDVAAGGWPRNALSAGREIGGKTLGVVGFGSIGQITAKLAQGLGMRVIAFDAAMDAGHAAFAATGVRGVGIAELTAHADVVSLHVPLADTTRHLFDTDRIAAMKPGAVLINSARGGVVDEVAVAEALRSGRLGGAALDVFESEPLGPGSVLVNCPNLILTPHIAGVTAEANERVSFMIAERVLEGLA
jgi:(S)-sulfolactate dehydrogenase